MILLYLWTWEDNASENTYTTPFQHFTTSSIGIIFLIIHAVSFFWSLAFIFTSYTFILNASCVFWYFSHGDWEEYNRKLPNPLGFIELIIVKIFDNILELL